MTDEQRKRAQIASAYGMGEIRVGLITGQYPNPNLSDAKTAWPGMCRCHVIPVIGEPK